MLRVMDAPGFYAAFPWGGYAQSKGATGTRSNAIGARALYSPLSLPRIFLRLVVHSATAAIHRAVHRGPPPERSGEGGSSLHGPISAMHRTQRAPFDEKHASKTTTRGRNYKLRRSSPRSRGPPSQSESNVWDTALICRRLGESNSSI